MKIINKNDEKYTISIDVDNEFIRDLMEVVKIVNTELCNRYNLTYRKNRFMNFDELIENQLWFRLTYMREGIINEIIKDKISLLEEYPLGE
jgi:hypothetical protein